MISKTYSVYFQILSKIIIMAVGREKMTIYDQNKTRTHSVKPIQFIIQPRAIGQEQFCSFPSYDRIPLT